METLDEFGFVVPHRKEKTQKDIKMIDPTLFILDSCKKIRNEYYIDYVDCVDFFYDMPLQM